MAFPYTFPIIWGEIMTTGNVRKPLIEVYIYRFLDGTPGVDTDGEQYKFVAGGSTVSKWTPYGREGAGIVSCYMSYGFDQISATASLVIQSPLDELGNLVTFKPMDRVVIKQGYDLATSYRTTFFGFIDSVELSTPEKLQHLECRDILKLAQNKYYVKGDRKLYYSEDIPDETGTITNSSLRQMETIISGLLVDSGIPSHRHNLPVTEITIAENQHFEIIYESAMDAIQRMCDLTGYKVWADSQGVVQMRDVYALAASGAAINLKTQLDDYDEETQTFSTLREGNVVSLRTKVDDDLRNHITVYNPMDENLSTTVFGDSPYIPNPPQYRKAEVSSYMLDTQAMINAVAIRIYKDLNRLRYTAEARTEGIQALSLGQTVSIQDEYVTTSSGYFVYEYTSSHDSTGYYNEITLVGGVGEGSAAIGNVAPIAQIAYEINIVNLDGTNYFDVWLSGSDSYDPDGSIETYAWDVSGESTKYGENVSYLVLATESSISVTLTVTDNMALTDTFTMAIPLGTTSGGNIRTRSIFYSSGTNVYATSDSGGTWDSFALY